MKRLNMFFKFPHSVMLIALLCTFLWQGCSWGPSGSCSTATFQNQPFPVTHYSYGAGAQLNVTQYNSITLRRGDSVTLLFPCVPVLVGVAPPELAVTYSGNNAKVIVTSLAATGASLTLAFNTINNDFALNYEFTVNVVGDVWPGDANADGRRNMHDLMPIALGIREGKSSSYFGALNYPPDPGQMLAFRNVPDWGPGQTFVFGGKTIDFKHADCNLDGKISLEDVEYLRAVLGPVAPPAFLVDAVNGLSLKAVYDNVNPIDVVITEDGEMGVRIGFDIEVENPSNATDSIFGVLFTRPVTETAQYQVDTTTFRFLGTNLFNVENETHMLWGQRFWNQLDVVNTSGDCAPVTDKPLDVGIFRIKGALQPLGSAGARCGNCQVTLLDILSPGQPLTNLDFHHHLIHGVAYTLGSSGLGITSIDCQDTTIGIDLSVLCEPRKSKPLIRDYVEDNGNGSSPHLEAWSSPDIWVRNQNDTLKEHQMPIPKQMAYVKVRVHNPSCTPVENATVTLYAAPFQAALQGSDLVSVGTVTNVNIPQWGSTIVTIPWKVNSIPGINDPAATYTLLATVGNPAPALPSGQLGTVVLDNATMAMRNTKTLRSADGIETLAEFFMGATTTTPVRLNLQLVQGSTSHPASEYGKLIMQMAGVGAHFGCTSVGANAYQVDPGVQYAALEINPSSNIKVSYQKYPSGGPSGPLSYTYLLWLTAGGVDYPGLTFKITLP
jgi:hypothetical protein